MEVSGLAFRMLLETAEAEGIATARVVAHLPFGADHLTSPRNRFDWDVFLAANERVADLLDRDPERLRRLGERMMQMPSFAFMKRMARLVVSPAMLYDLGYRWLVPTVMPGAPTAVLRTAEGGRLLIEHEMPWVPRSAEWFFHIHCGNLRATPQLLGLPPAVVDACVEPKRLRATIRLPASHTLPERARRSLRALRSPRRIYELLDEQRSELERAFATSVASHHKFRELLDTLPTLLLIHRDGHILWVNRTWLRALGWRTAEEVVGRSVLDMTHASSRAVVQDRLADPASGPRDGPTTVRLVRRDGREITVEVSPAQTIDFDGPARLVVAIDVSERVALQQRLITADRIASTGLLGAGVAHEINNPLAYALASLELAMRQVSRLEGAPPQLRELLGTAREGLERVRTIVHDLRMLTRTDDLPALPVDVREVLDSTLTLAAGALPARLRVVREYANVPLALAQGPRLGQVALNLVLNAVESMTGPGELRVRTLVDAAGRVAFEVEDTGSGIAPEVASRIFDPFFTTKPTGRGTGLGLAICHYIVVGFGGEISVRSTVGSGSTFRVSLPQVPVVATSHSAEVSLGPG